MKMLQNFILVDYENDFVITAIASPPPPQKKKKKNRSTFFPPNLKIMSFLTFTIYV